MTHIISITSFSAADDRVRYLRCVWLLALIRVVLPARKGIDIVRTYMAYHNDVYMECVNVLMCQRITWQCLGGNCVPFACMYSFGNCVALCATFFLVGNHLIQIWIWIWFDCGRAVPAAQANVHWGSQNSYHHFPLFNSCDRYIRTRARYCLLRLIFNEWLI